MFGPVCGIGKLVTVHEEQAAAVPKCLAEGNSGAQQSGETQGGDGQTSLRKDGNLEASVHRLKLLQIYYGSIAVNTYFSSFQDRHVTSLKEDGILFLKSPQSM